MTIKILIVDDEPEIRHEVAECLSEEGYECLSAVNGEEGLELIRGDPSIAVVLADIQMPGRSGLEMIAAAKAEIGDDRILEFIIMTGHGGAREAIDAFPFIRKPLDIGEFLEMVKENISSSDTGG